MWKIVEIQIELVPELMGLRGVNDLKHDSSELKAGKLISVLPSPSFAEQ